MHSSYGHLTTSPDEAHSGAAALLTVANFHRLSVDHDDLKELVPFAGDRLGTFEILAAARQLGFNPTPLEGDYDELPEVERPNLVVLRGADGASDAFAVLYAITPGEVTLGLPWKSCIEHWDRGTFDQRWTGDCIRLAPDRTDAVRRALAKRSRGWSRLLFAAVSPPRTAKAVWLAFTALVVALASAAPLAVVPLSSQPWLRLCLVGLAVGALSSLWSALLAKGCRSCGEAQTRAGILPLASLGVATYTGLLLLVWASPNHPWIPLALWWLSGAHAWLLLLLAASRTVCVPCILTAGGAWLACGGWCLAHGVEGREALLAFGAGVATLAVAIRFSKLLFAHKQNTTATQTAQAVLKEVDPSLPIRVVAYTRAGCPMCVYWESVVKPAIEQDFGADVVVEERSTRARDIPTPLVVVAGTLSFAFFGMPQQEDKYAPIQHAIAASKDRRLDSIAAIQRLWIVNNL